MNRRGTRISAKISYNQPNYRGHTSSTQLRGQWGPHLQIQRHPERASQLKDRLSLFWKVNIPILAFTTLLNCFKKKYSTLKYVRFHLLRSKESSVASHPPQHLVLSVSWISAVLTGKVVPATCSGNISPLLPATDEKFKKPLTQIFHHLFPRNQPKLEH